MLTGDATDSALLERIVEIGWELWHSRHVLEDLAAATAAERQLAELPDHPTLEVRGSRRGWLGTLLLMLYERTGKPSALEDSIAALEAAGVDLPKGTQQYCECISGLASALAHRHGRTGDVNDINRAVELAVEAVRLAKHAGDPRLAEYYLRAGAAMADRFANNGDDQSLIDGIEFFRLSLAATEQTEQPVSGRCADLARALLMKYERWGRAEDLDEAGVLYRRAIDELPVGHHEAASHKSGLGGVLSTRYKHYGDSADLSPAVELLAEAFEMTASGDPAKQIRLGRLAEALLVRFGHFSNEDDLKRAIELFELGVKDPGSNPSMSISMQLGLAGALRTRGLSRRDLNDLRRSHGLLQDVVESLRTAPPDASLLFNLASLRHDIYWFTRSEADLSAAISGMRDAVAASPFDSPGRAHAKTFLSQLLLIQAEQRGAAEDPLLVVEAVALARESALDPSLIPALGLLAAATWAERSTGEERLAAYERALAILPSVSTHGLTVADSLARLRDLPSIASDACAAFIGANQIDRAVEVLEEGRAMSIRLRTRWRADTQDLRAVRPDLADAYETALEAANTAMSGLDVDPRGESRHLEDLLAQVRAVDGFARFGTPRNAKEIQELAGDATVVYLNVSIERCDALIITTAGVTVLPLPTTAAEIARRADKFQAAVHAAGVSKSMPEVVRGEGTARDVAAWLWDNIVGPVIESLQLPQLDDTWDPTLWPRIWWIPTGHLVVIPMQVAGHHSSFGTRATDVSLTAIDRVVSTQLPSIETLAAARRVPEDPTDEIRCLIVATANPANEPTLDGVAEEVRCLIARLGRERIMLLADDAAIVPDGPSTKAQVVEELPKHTWVHFACHAAPDDLRPTDSQLILTDHEIDPFRVEDLLAVRPSAPRLAFFSACSTAQISPDLAHEPVHFGVAASLAGYAHSILTLWPVRDDPDVADLTYESLLRAATWPTDAATAAAVHSANRQMRDRSANALHRWAATVHQGP